MDLRKFFKKIRDLEKTINEEYPLVVSLATDEGGKAGIFTEVSRYQAARMIIEGRAQLASAEEKLRFEEDRSAAQKAAEELELAKHMHFSVIGRPELSRMGFVKPKPSGK